MRENALPTLISKESALRVEVKKAREETGAIEQELKKQFSALSEMQRLWGEIPQGLITVSDVNIIIKKLRV